MSPSAYTPSNLAAQGLKLAKGSRTRQQEEELVSRLLLQVSWMVWLLAGLGQCVPAALLAPCAALCLC